MTAPRLPRSDKCIDEIVAPRRRAPSSMLGSLVSRAPRVSSHSRVTEPDLASRQRASLVQVVRRDTLDVLERARSGRRVQ